MPAEPDDRILDLLNYVKWNLDGTLTYRRSCAHGVCASEAPIRLGANLTRQLAATWSQRNQAVGQIVEHLTQQLMGEAAPMPTPLTKTNHKRGRER